MRKAYTILAAGLMACALGIHAVADDGIKMVYMTVTPQTNAAAVSAGQQTKAVPSGWIDTVIVDVGGGGGSPTSTVTIATAGSEDTGAARDILTATVISADGSYPIRDIVTTQAGSDISNTPARIPVMGDSLILSAYNANTTTNTLAVYVIIKTE